MEMKLKRNLVWDTGTFSYIIPKSIICVLLNPISNIEIDWETTQKYAWYVKYYKTL